MEGISNQDIVNLKILKKYFVGVFPSNYIKKYFVCVFPSNYITKFISFQRMMIEKKERCPFIIMNTDRSNKTGTH